MSARWAAVPRRERLLLGAIVGVALVVRIAYVALHGGAPLDGDEIEYALEGKLAANGHWFWSTTPYGIAHASIFKAPLYPAWVGRGSRSSASTRAWSCSPRRSSAPAPSR